MKRTVYGTIDPGVVAGRLDGPTLTLGKTLLISHPPVGARSWGPRVGSNSIPKQAGSGACLTRVLRMLSGRLNTVVYPAY
jgi:hypothetical protein